MTAVSVIVPARDAAATIGRTLEALAAQDLDGEFEVIVVDDGSTDETVAIAEGAPGRATVLRQAGAGPAAARNRGVAASSGAVLAFTDADCFPQADWLGQGLAAIEAGADLVQGAVRADPGSPPRPFDRTVWVTRESGLYETANLFCRRELFDRIGGFEDWLAARLGKQLAEDVWLGWRARRAGAVVRFDAATRVDHAVFRRGGGEYLAERPRVGYFPAIVAKVPELRSEFLYRQLFLSSRSARFDLAVAGVVAAAWRASPLPLALTAPYLRILAGSAMRWRREAPRVAAVELAGDLVGLAALVAGSARHRSPVF